MTPDEFQSWKQSRADMLATRLPAEMAAKPLPYDTQMVMARGQSWIIKTPASGIPARTSSLVPGRAVCDSFVVDENPPTPGLVEETNQLPTANTLEQEVYNLSDDVVPGDEFFLAVQVGNVLVVSNRGTGGGGNKRVQFRSTTKMTYGEIEGVVILTEGSTGFAIGDPITVSDPFNLFMDAEPDAIGWAYERKTTDECELDEARWEVEELSLPINRVTGIAAACIKKGDETATITVLINNGSDMLSGYHNVDIPPEFSESITNITAANTYHLDTCINNKVTIERRPMLRPSDPDNCDIPLPTTSSQMGWVIVQVEEQIARWIKVAASVVGSVVTWTYDGLAWDGCDPFVLCDPPDIDTVCPNECVTDGACGVACYNPEAHRYEVISTSSALMGEPESDFVVTGIQEAGALYPCETEVTIEEVCLIKKGTPQTQRVNLFSTMDVDVITGATTYGSNLKFNTATITTCSTTVGSPVLVDICPLLCLCDQFYNCCPEQCGCDASECTWDWDPFIPAWVNTIPCPEGCECSDEPTETPGGSDPLTYTYPCESEAVDCCDGMSASTAVDLVDFQFTDPNYFDTTQGTLVAGSSTFAASGPCGATLTFDVEWQNLSCGVTQQTSATAVLKKFGTCCYWEVTLTQPTAICTDGFTSLGDGWPGAVLKVPTCDGETAMDCSTFTGDCGTICDDGGFAMGGSQPTFTVTNIGDCN